MKTNHTINSGIVKDILAELARKKMKRKYLGGGLATQFTFPSELHRFTSDIDLETPEYTKYSEYKKFVNEIAKPLVARGYNLKFGRQRETYDALFSREDSQIVLQIPRRSAKKLGQEEKRLKRELSNSETMPYAEGELRVINANDLMIRKLGRADMFRREYGLKIPRGIGIEEEVERANKLKESLKLSNLNPEEMAKKVAYIRMLCDLSDINVILKHIKGIDVPYIMKTLIEYPTQDPKSLQSLAEETLI